MNRTTPRGTNCIVLATLLGSIALGLACATPGPRPSADRAAVNAVLDAFHTAASTADGDAYFAQLATDVVFLGTDASERWSRDEFHEYANPHFSAGRGWTYTPLERFVGLDDTGDTAWFDERLANDKYGECRGTGVLQKRDSVWKIVQYNLMFPIPNELSLRVVELIREQSE